VPISAGPPRTTSLDWFDVTFRWYLVTTLVTIGLAPFTVLVFRRMTNRGASVVRPLSALFLIWPVWFLASVGDAIVPFTAVTLWISAFVLGAAAWGLGWREDVLNANTFRHLLVAEAGHGAAFGFFLWFRGYGPAANLQEKPSDLMMLASSMHSTSMPPADAWLAGEPVNYYYLGYAIWAAFGKMIGTSPAIVFNLALASVFAMTFVATIGLAANILSRWCSNLVARIGGLVATILLIIDGNPWAASRVVEAAKSQWKAWFFDGIGWQSTRIIVDDPASGANPISEFPSFSFILGDLHPHVLALPYTVTALMFAWMLLTLGRLRENESFLRRDGGRLAIAGFAIGSLYAMNSWDFPTYLLISLLALALGTVGVAVQDRLLGGGVLVLSALVSWLPFYVTFEAPARSTGTPFSDWIGNVPLLGGILASVASYQGERTSPQDYFSIFGFMYLIALVLILTEAWRRREDVLISRAEARGTTWERDQASHYFAIATALLCFLGSLIVPAPLLVICGLPVIVVWLLLERDFRVTPANIALVMYAIALIMTLIPEFFYVTDYYGGSRMNTVFKIYYQVWLLMAVASALAAVSIWKAFRRNLVARYALPVAMTGILALGMTYPVVAGHQWLEWRAPNREWKGVDGLAYLVEDQGGLYAAEYEAIQWLLDNADEQDVLLAAGGGEWREELGRVSSGSGVPTLIGWTGHENQWHLGDPDFQSVVNQRLNDINLLYSGPPSTELLDRYGVTLIYVGPTETWGIGEQPQPGWVAPGPFPAASDQSYPGDGWTEVFNEDGSRIYRREGT
jgi:YYY domain-containing protein